MRKILFLLIVIFTSLITINISFAENPLDTNWRDYFLRRTLNPMGIISTIYVDSADIYIGGLFDNPYSITTLKGLAKWRDTVWARFGNDTNFGTNGWVTKILKKDGIYVAGGFDTIGISHIKNLAKWTGSDWESFNTGFSSGMIFSMIFKDTLLFVVGAFDTIGQAVAANIAYYDGSIWSSFGGGVRGTGYLNHIKDIIIFDSLMYVCGIFDTVGNIAAKNIAVWNFNSSEWSNIGDANDYVRAMCLTPDNELYIGGDFDSIINDGDTLRANHIAKYSNGEWETLSSGTDGLGVTALTFDSGLLYVGGAFQTVGSDTGKITVNNIAIWNGSQWEAMGSGVDGYVETLTSNDSVIYVGGQFGKTGEIHSNNIGIWSLKPLDPPIISEIEDDTLDSNILVDVFPNPSKESFTIKVNLPGHGKLKIRVLDLLGIEIKEIININVAAGMLSFIVDLQNANNGIYLCEIKFNDKRIVKKLMNIN